MGIAKKEMNARIYPSGGMRDEAGRRLLDANAGVQTDRELRVEGGCIR
jgi:hypothetical protein